MFFSHSTYAIEVNDLYSAKVELDSRTQKEQKAALKSAFKAVLVKIAGNEQILANAFIRNEIQKYPKYLAQYNYITEFGINKLVATFDENKVNQVFFQENLPLWGKLRPLVLFWIVTEEGLNRRIISETDDSLLHKQILTLAEQKGLPIILPLMDLTDMQNIQMSDLWGRFIEPINTASQRYAPETIVVIRVAKKIKDLANITLTPECDLHCMQSQKIVDWHIVTKQSNKVESGEQYQGANELELITTAMSDITAHISKKYALTTEIDNDLVIDVANIDSLTKYVELTEFLTSLSAINSFKLVKAEGTNRRFHLTLMGSIESLFSSLKLNNKLTQYSDPLLEEQVDDVPVFYWGTQ